MQIIAKHLKAALLAAAKKDIRYYLNGVLIDERHIVGCDGARIHVIKHGGEWLGAPVIIPRQIVELALKLKTPHLEVTPESLGSIPFKAIEGRFPDYTRVMLQPNIAPVFAVPVANLIADQLCDAVEAIKLCTGNAHAALTFVNKQWVWSNGHVQVVLMPSRETKVVPKLTALDLM